LVSRSLHDGLRLFDAALGALSIGGDAATLLSAGVIEDFDSRCGYMFMPDVYHRINACGP